MSATSPRTHDGINSSGSLSRARQVFHKLKRRASALLKRDIHTSLPSESDFITTHPVDLARALDANEQLFTPSLSLVTQYEPQRSPPYSVPSLIHQDDYPTFSIPHPYSNISAYHSSPSLPSSSFSSSPRAQSSFYSSSSTYTPFSSESPIKLSVHEEEDPFVEASVHITSRNHIHHHTSCPPPPSSPSSPSPSSSSSTFRTSTSNRPRRISLPCAAPPPTYPPPLPPRSPHRPPPPHTDAKLLTPPPSPEFQRREIKREGGRTEKKLPAPLWLDRSRSTRSTSSILDTFPSPPPTPREFREFLLTSPTPSLRVKTKSPPQSPSLLPSPPATPRRGGNWVDMSVDEEEEG